MLKLSRLLPVPMFTRYSLVDGTRMACAWLQFRERALVAHHWIR